METFTLIDPPNNKAQPRIGTEMARTIQRLREHTGQWALVWSGGSDGAYRRKQWLTDRGIEAQVTAQNGKREVYGRYVA